MKNKKLMYILLPLVFGIWVTIIIKVFDFVKAPQYVNDENFNIMDSQIKSEVDTFVIVAKYPDPFLKKQKLRKIQVSNSNTGGEIKRKKLPVKSDIKEKNVNWPQMDYYGLVNNYTKNQKIGFLKINKKDYLIKQGDTIEGIGFEYITNDSIKVHFSDDTRVIKKRK